MLQLMQSQHQAIREAVRAGNAREAVAEALDNEGLS
jgi:hypothetical protein